jgi:hypothetical protein
MSFDTLGDLNWLAVIVATIAYVALGALWYAPPVLGRPWMRAGAVEMPEGGPRPSPAIYAVPLVSSLIASIAVGMLVEATGSDSLGDGIVLGLVTGVGFAATIALITATFETTKPNAMVWGAINGGYHLVGLLVAAMIVSAW